MMHILKSFNDSKLINGLRRGSIAVIPTDTIYGIVCSALDPEAVKRLYEVRQRDPKKPSIILIGDVSDLDRFGLHPSDLVSQALSQMWPGRVSVILRDLAFRLPDHNELRELLRQTGPLVAPSANLEGQPTATTVAEAQIYFGDDVAFYVDGGVITGSPSRLIRLHEDGSSEVLRG